MGWSLRFFGPVLVIVLLSTMIIPMTRSAAQTPPPTVGNWVIADETVIEDQVIVLRGNLIVEGGGDLTLRGCELYIHCDFPGHRWIQVDAGGGLHCTDTRILANVANMDYYFWTDGVVEIERCEVRDVFSAGINMRRTSVGTILDSDIHDNAANSPGITIQDSATAIVKGNRIYNNLIGIAALEEASGQIIGNEIHNNYRGIETQHNSALEISSNVIAVNSEYGILSWDASDLVIAWNDVSAQEIDGIVLHDDTRATVTYNTISQNTNYGLLLMESSTATITDNTIANNSKEGLHTAGSSSGWIERNLITSTKAGHGLGAYENSIAHILGNTVSSNNQRGIVCEDESIVTIQGNLVEKNGYHGVQALNSTSAVIEGNIITRNILDGISCVGSSRVTIEDNEITWNTREGIMCAERSNVDIESNEVTDSGFDGIMLQDDATVNVVGNIIAQNDMYGVLATERSSSEIADNYIAGNGADGIRAQDNAVAAAVGNTLTNNDDGLSIMNLARVEALDNDIEANTGAGVAQYDNTYLSLVANDISSNGVCGVLSQLGAGGEMSAIGNTISANEDYGLLVTLPQNTRTRVVGCQITGSGYVGVAVTNGASPLIENCTISGSADYGMYIRDISRPRVYNCTITDSGQADVWSGNSSHGTFIGSAFEGVDLFFNDTGSDVSLGWWALVEVVDDLNLPVELADVQVRNSAGTVVYEGTSGSGGLTPYIPIVERVLSLGGELPMNPHTFAATIGNRTGSIEVTVTRNRAIRVTLGLAELLPDKEKPQSGLAIAFVSIDEGDLVRGKYRVEVTCSRFIDVVVFRLEQGDSQVFLGSSEVSSRRASFHWNTTEHDNGGYTLVAEGLNRTFNLTAEGSIKVYVDNERGSLISTLVSAGIAGMASLGAAAAVGSGAAIRGAGGVEDAAGEYAEERLFEVERGRVTARASIQIVMILASAILLTIFYTWALYNGRESITGLFLYLLMGVGAVVLAMETVELLVARRNGIESQFTPWATGLLTLVITTMAFRLPFGSPGKTKMETGRDERGEGLSSLAMLLTAPALLPAFIVLMTNGHYELGVIGGYTAVMLFFVDSLPIRPLEGKRVYDWSRGAWAVTMLVSIALLLSWQQVWIANSVYNLLGGVCILLLLGAALASRRQTSAASPVVVLQENA